MCGQVSDKGWSLCSLSDKGWSLYSLSVKRWSVYSLSDKRWSLYSLSDKREVMLSLYDKRWSRKILIDKKLKKKKIKVEWQGLNLRLLLKIGWSIYNSITMMGKIWTFFLCCRYWSAGWMAGQNLSYCGTYYDMFFESLSICLLGSFTWFSKNFFIYIRFQYWSSFNLLGSNAGRQLC